MITLVAKPVVISVQERLKERIRKFTKLHQRAPFLAVVLVGEDPASVIYTRKKGETALSLEMEHETIVLPTKSTPEEVKTVINRLNQDPNVDGILLQRPLPPGFREEEMVYWISPEKDVDAFHPVNAGRLVLGLPCFQPCTPTGVMVLLEHYGIKISGKIACVIGRSSIVGKPMASLLLRADATVIQCHSKTPKLQELTKKADILVVAAGKPSLIDGSYIRDGAVVVDVGIHRTSAGKVVGDVVYEDAAKKASAITPVPGGVGPMTIAILMENTLAAAEARAKMKR